MNRSVFIWRNISFDKMMFSWLRDYEIPSRQDIETMISIIEKRNLFTACSALMDLFRYEREEMLQSHRFKNEALKKNLKIIKMLKKEIQ
jgi:hypothetical protein